MFLATTKLRHAFKLANSTNLLLYSRAASFSSGLTSDHVREALQKLVDTKGKSVLDAGLVHSIDTEGNEVSIKVMLSKDFRKNKQVIS